MVLDRFDRLAQHAADLRLDVEWSLDLPAYIHGYYEDDMRLVVLNHRCTQAQAVAAFAHEIGHAEYGDRCSTPAVERRADEFGAGLVITPAEYAEAEREVGEHPGALARRLEVTRDLVLSWRRWYERGRCGRLG